MRTIIKTNDGYMVQLLNGDYLCDVNGDNLWDTLEEAKVVASMVESKWAKANEAFYRWEQDYGDESDLSDDDRMIWVEGYLQALRDAEKPLCLYCGGNCPNDEEHACDGYLGDVDGLYSEAK